MNDIEDIIIKTLTVILWGSAIIFVIWALFNKTTVKHLFNN